MPTKSASNPILDFINGPLVGRYFDELTADMEDALGIANRALSNAALKPCSASALSAYRKDKTYLSKSSKNFYDEYSRVREGKSKDLKKLQSTYETAVRDLEILESQNEMFGAVIDANLGVLLSRFFLPVVALLKVGAPYIKLKRELDALRKDLESAERATNSKMLKAGLGAAIAGVMVMTGPIGIVGTVGVALGTTAAGVVIDTVVGNGGSVGPLDTARTASNTAIDCYDQLERGIPKSIPPMLALLNITVDGADAGFALMKQKNIEARIRTVVQEYSRAAMDMRKATKELPKLQRAADKAYDDALRKASGYSATTSKRMKAVKEMKKYKAPK